MIRRYLVLSLSLLCIVNIGYTAETGGSYVEKYSSYALYVQHKYGIPASVTLGIAMHESANGNSKVARNLNNHFGFKGHHHRRSRYREFSNPEEGFLFFGEKMSQKKHLGLLFIRAEQNVDKWLRAIQRSGYAKSRVWVRQIKNIINRNNLKSLDTISRVEEANPLQ